ncbi:MAG: DUF4976 domain-containing protein, partial [Lentisphaerae bacterium]
VLYYHYYDHGFHNVARHDGVRTERYKLIHFYTHDWYELYDLKNDPHEMHNLARDPRYAQLLEQMKELLKKERTRYAVPKKVFVPPYPRKSRSADKSIKPWQAILTK